jgi:hypothetical protein
MQLINQVTMLSIILSGAALIRERDLIAFPQNARGDGLGSQHAAGLV